MAAYRPGKGFDKEALARLRARRQENAGPADLPAEDKSKQWDALLGVSAKKIPRCGVCTKPADGDQLLCSACATPVPSAVQSIVIRREVRPAKKSVEQDSSRSGSRTPSVDTTAGDTEDSESEDVLSPSSGEKAQTPGLATLDTKESVDAESHASAQCSNETSDLAKENARLRAEVLQQRTILAEQNARLRVAQSQCAVPDATLGALPPYGQDPWLYWRLHMVQALQQQSILAGSFSPHSKAIEGRGFKSSGRNRAETNSSLKSGSRSRANTDGSFSCNTDSDEEDDVTQNVPLTTVMMRNIPNSYSRKQLLDLIDKHGFTNSYDLVYLPVDFKKWVGLGYAFINFCSTSEAERFRQHFNGFSEWSSQSSKVCEVSWSDALQGLNNNVDRYRNIPVMHTSVPDEFKPVLFKNGKRIPFPPPTRKIKDPNLIIEETAKP